MLKISGGCHCGAVRYTAEIEPNREALRCNCSICSATGFVHLIIPKSQFHLQQGTELLTEYRFNTRLAQHLFCSRCGVKAFYRPRSNPDGVSLNLNCIDAADKLNCRMGLFDGQNWEAHAAELAELSQ